MSTRRRIFTAFAVFFVAASLLAVAEAKKPNPKLASLDQPVAQKNEAPPPKIKEKPRAKKYMPVGNFGDY